MFKNRINVGAIVCFVLFGYCLTGSVECFSQTKADTTVQLIEEDSVTTKRRSKGLTKPAIAAILSTILPGTGQIYNKTYWKVPIVYILMGGMIWLSVNAQYTYNHDATIYREGYSNPTTSFWFVQYAQPYYNANYTLAQVQEQITVQVDNDRSSRDEAYLVTALLYAINIVDACVDAHLKEFDVNEKIAMKIQPTFMTSRFSSFTAGLSVQITFKSNNKIPINAHKF